MIFAANHHSHIDTPLVLTSIPDRWRYRMFVGAAADYFFGNRVTAALSALVMGAIPIERTKVTRRSADQAAALIAEGWSMLIFPEGGRSPDGWGQPFRGGAAYLSLRCGVPVVPVHLRSTGRVLAKGDTVPRPSRTRVTFGMPLWPREEEDSRRLAARISTRWPPSVTKPAPTGGRPAGGPTPPRPRPSPARRSGAGAGPGPAATAGGAPSPTTSLGPTSEPRANVRHGAVPAHHLPRMRGISPVTA